MTKTKLQTWFTRAQIAQVSGGPSETQISTLGKLGYVTPTKVNGVNLYTAEDRYVAVLSTRLRHAGIPLSGAVALARMAWKSRVSPADASALEIGTTRLVPGVSISIAANYDGSVARDL